MIEVLPVGVRGAWGSVGENEPPEGRLEGEEVGGSGGRGDVLESPSFVVVQPP